MAKIFKNSIPLLFFVIISFFSFFSSVVESGAGPDVNVLTKYCGTLAKDSHGDFTKVERSKDCSNYLNIFKTGDLSSFIGIKFIETSNSISQLKDLIEAGLKGNTDPLKVDLMERCRELYGSSLLKIDQAYDIYRKNVQLNKMKTDEAEELKKLLEFLVVEATSEQETCISIVNGLGNSPPQLLESSNLGSKVVDGSHYITKALCQFGYAPQNSKHC